MDVKTLKPILESLIMASAKPISIDRILSCFSEKEVPDKKTLRGALKQLAEDYTKLKSSVELKEVSSGYRFQVRKEYSSWAAKLWEEKPARYSRALLETLSLVAYKQPISRGEIEKIRGVSVSTQIMKTLIEREWVHIVGHRDVPGRPAIYATTKEFLDYFNLSSLEELPPLAEIKDIDKINGELDLPEPANGDSENVQATDGQPVNPSASETSADDASVTVVNLEADVESEDKNSDKVDVAEAMTAEH
ncbi:Segregation and condensation protein B [hydrothermal vent metagenome]|uniref:Segregation and condensation protein B n=1 Tax=hydrothermal vent metagenome TaxID=652676 RepID=A0A3B0ZGX4_9ZZZZ